MSDTRDGDQRPPAGTDDLRDMGIETHYRAASTEMPSAAADAAILAQARAAVRAAGGAANDASWSKRLRAPLALAACAVLAVGIVTRIGLEPPTGVPDSAERAAETAPANATSANAAPMDTAGAAPAGASAKTIAAAPVNEAVPVAPSPARTDAAPATTTQMGERKRAPMAAATTADGMRKPSAVAPEQPLLAKKEAATDAVAPPAAPPATTNAPVQRRAADARPFANMEPHVAEPSAPPAQASVTLSGVIAGRAESTGPGSAGGSAARPAILSAVREAALTPERWLAYIIDLRRVGEHAAAAASLIRFRARHPEQAIPAQASPLQASPPGEIK